MQRVRFGWTLLAFGIVLGACATGTEVPFGEEEEDDGSVSVGAGMGGDDGMGGDMSVGTTTSASVATTGSGIGGMGATTGATTTVTAGTSTVASGSGQTSTGSLVGSTGSLVGAIGSTGAIPMTSSGTGLPMMCTMSSQCTNAGECCLALFNICGPDPMLPGLCAP